MPQLGPLIRDNLMKGAREPSSTLDAPWLTMDAGKMQEQRDFDVVVVSLGERIDASVMELQEERDAISQLGLI